VRRAFVLLLPITLLCACSSGDPVAENAYEWTATAAEANAVGTARKLDAQTAGVWAAYSDGLVLHFIYDFCVGLDAATDVEDFLDERARAQGEAVVLPLLVGSAYLCADRSDAVGDWIARRATDE